MKIQYSPALDGLRALCIIFTLFNHIEGSPWFINGSVGVDVFFALSGFLITSIIHDIQPKGLLPYFIRRVLRIAPVYYLSFAVTVSLALAAHHFSVGESRLDQLREIFFPSILFSRELAGSPTLFGQAWTVGIEEKFYLTWPLLLLLVRNTWARVAIITVFSLGLIFTGQDATLVRGYVGIGFGALAAFAYVEHKFYVSTAVATFALLGSYIACLQDFHAYQNLLISATAALLVPSLYTEASRLRRLMEVRWLVHLGKLTFSIYMFHVVIFFSVKVILPGSLLSQWWAVFIIGYPLCILISHVIYTHFEAPLIALGKRAAKQVEIGNSAPPAQSFGKQGL